MFDQLVESNSAEADFKPRRKFFLVSSVVVGILFATAVVASIYAADFDLGTDNFDLAELLTPIAETEPADEPEPSRNQTRDTQQNDQTTRQTNMARVDEVQSVPTEISTVRNQYLSRPIGDFIISNGPERTGPPPEDSGNRDIGTPSRAPVAIIEDDIEKAPPAPPKIEKPKAPVSGGVMTGKATSLPQPVYSAAARAVGAQGVVTVQITVDESGRVISAKALDGNAMLRPAAVAAAWKAKFDPTTLTGVPVKVTGVITYNFKH